MPVYETDPSMRYATEEVWFAASLYVADWEQDFHELMLNDHIRMAACENAIKRLVQPGMTVVDLGTGTGILAQWALEAGARTVDAIDMNENMIEEARARLSHAGYSDGVRLHRALSYEVTLPERVDVVMSEILGKPGRQRRHDPHPERRPGQVSQGGGPHAAPAGQCVSRAGVCRPCSPASPGVPLPRSV